MRAASILIVDDHPANLVALRAVLDSPRYELIEAACGSEAVELCQAREFALVILDIQMPTMDGFEAARRIKLTEKNEGTPIVFITAVYREDPFIRKGYEAGAVDYFGKPFNPDILRAKVSIYTDLYLKSKRLVETEELLKEESQIKTLLEAMPVGVVVADAKGRIYETNAEGRRIWARADAHFHSNVLKALNGKALESHQAFIEQADGTKMVVANSALPIRGKSGKVLGAIIVLRDVTQAHLRSEAMLRPLASQ